MTYGSGNSGDYKKLKGQTIQVTDTDPLPYAGAWSSGGNLNQARYSLAGAGTQTAGLAFGGYSAPSRRTETEEYNGTAWTESGDLNLARNELTGAGTQTSALAAGGYSTAATNDAETYNGSTWTEITNLNTARDGFGSTAVGAVNTAVIVVGGQPFNAAVEQWNGSSWTEITELNANKELNACAGTVTSGITIGGKHSGPTISNQVETWNGSSWTEVSEINNARSRAGASGVSNTAALVYAGEDGPSPDYTGNTESWDGTSWTEVADMSTARYGLTGGGGAMPNATALASGGYTNSSSGMTNTEEWSFPSAPGVQEGQLWIKTATGTSSVMKGYQAQGTGAWASGGNMNTARNSPDGSGNSNNALIASGGYDGTGVVSITESWDGSSWTEVGDMNTGKSQGATSGHAPSLATIHFGGGPAVANAETWNGSAWTEVGDLNTGRRELGGTGSGTSNALAICGQYDPTARSITESWNGSSWTEVADTNTARQEDPGAGGTNTDAIVFGGDGGNSTANAETWDGSAWTEVGNLNTARGMGAGAGTTGSSALFIGGVVTPGTTHKSIVEQWNGTSWTEVADLAATRRYGGAGNSAMACITMGGLNSSNSELATSEIWTVPFVTKTIGTD